MTPCHNHCQILHLVMKKVMVIPHWVLFWLSWLHVVSEIYHAQWGTHSHFSGPPRPHVLSSCSEYQTLWPLTNPNGWKFTWCRQGQPHPLASPWFLTVACTTALWHSQTVRAFASTTVGLPIHMIFPTMGTQHLMFPHRRAPHLEIICWRIGQLIPAPGQLLWWGPQSHWTCLWWWIPFMHTWMVGSIFDPPQESLGCANNAMSNCCMVTLSWERLNVMSEQLPLHPFSFSNQRLNAQGVQVSPLIL